MVLQQKPPVVVLACARLPQLPDVCMEDATFTLRATALSFWSADESTSYMQATGDGGSHREVCGVAPFFYINHLQLAGEQ